LIDCLLAEEFDATTSEAAVDTILAAEIFEDVREVQARALEDLHAPLYEHFGRKVERTAQAVRFLENLAAEIRNGAHL